MNKKLIGIGHAIIDVLCKVDDDFLQDHNLVKGSMTLIDLAMVKKLSNLHVEKISSGGSVANTMATLGNLGVDCKFFGIVGDDEFGEKFITEIEKTNCQFIGKKVSNQTSAICFILITSDGERTMCTYLGCASQIDENFINENDFLSTHLLYLEGYLWDSLNTSNALKKAIKIAKKNNVKIAFSLSDSFCVARHKVDFINLIENDLDILFANESEFLELSSQSQFSVLEAKNFIDHASINNQQFLSIITRSQHGCCIINKQNPTLEISVKKVEKIVDTSGAGDNFASGWLFGYCQNYSTTESSMLANLLASHIIQQLGARFNKEQILKILNK
jgi:fructokinase